MGYCAKTQKLKFCNRCCHTKKCQLLFTAWRKMRLTVIGCGEIAFEAGWNFGFEGHSFSAVRMIKGQ